MIRLRDLVSYSVLVLFLGALGGFAWFTRHPESPYLERAQAWPLVGSVVSAFRDSYISSEASRSRAGKDSLGPDLAVVDELQNVQSGEAIIARSIWLPPEMVLYEKPDFESPEVSRTDGYIRVPVIRQDKGWYLVSRDSHIGWVYHEGYYSSDQPPLGSVPSPVIPLESHPPNPDRLQLGRLIMGEDGVKSRAGPYLLYTDAQDQDLLDFCDKVASQVEVEYQERYKLQPVGKPAEAILLFERAIDYRVLQATDTTLEGLLASGHAGVGMAALYVGGRSRREVAATMIHEITHLLNRRSLGPALPAWLNEGIADDMAASRLEENGTIDAKRLAGETTRIGNVIVSEGALGAAIQLRKSMESTGLLPVEELLGMGWKEFVRSDPKQLNYAQSSFWIRYLLSDPQLEPRFKAYLHEIASGGQATPGALQVLLGRDWSHLQLGFSTWVGLQGVEEL